MRTRHWSSCNVIVDNAPLLTVSHDDIDRVLAILSEPFGESLPDEMASGAA